jgi:hypothetical protein
MVPVSVLKRFDTTPSGEAKQVKHPKSLCSV